MYGYNKASLKDQMTDCSFLVKTKLPCVLKWEYLVSLN